MCVCVYVYFHYFLDKYYCSIKFFWIILPLLEVTVKLYNVPKMLLQDGK